MFWRKQFCRLLYRLNGGVLWEFKCQNPTPPMWWCQEGVPFGRWLGLDEVMGWSSANRMNATLEVTRSLAASLVSTTWEHGGKSAISEPGREPSPELSRLPHVRLPALGLREIVLMFKATQSVVFAVTAPKDRDRSHRSECWGTAWREGQETPDSKQGRSGGCEGRQ